MFMHICMLMRHHWCKIEPGHLHSPNHKALKWLSGSHSFFIFWLGSFSILVWCNSSFYVCDSDNPSVIKPIKGVRRKIHVFSTWGQHIYLINMISYSEVLVRWSIFPLSQRLRKSLCACEDLCTTDAKKRLCIRNWQASKNKSSGASN